MIFSSGFFFQKLNKQIQFYYYDTSGWLFFVLFWKKLKKPKRHFEINWPLVDIRVDKWWFLFNFCNHHYGGYKNKCVSGGFFRGVGCLNRAVGNKPNQLVRGGEELLKYLFIECKHQQSSGLWLLTPPNSEIICGQNVGKKVVCWIIFFFE